MGAGKDKLTALHALRVKLQNRIVLEAGERHLQRTQEALAAEFESPSMQAMCRRKAISHKCVADGYLTEVGRLIAEVEHLEAKLDQPVPVPTAWANLAAQESSVLEVA